MVTQPRKAFPDPQTIVVLSDLLDLPVATILAGFAASLGLPVRQPGSALDVVMPPGTEELTVEDREAIRVITRALINARRAVDDPPMGDLVDLARPPQPDLSRVAARRRLRDSSEPDHGV